MRQASWQWLATYYVAPFIWLDRVDSVGFLQPKQQNISVVDIDPKSLATETALKAGNFILWTGCFLFVSFIGAIWIWLGANNRRSMNILKERDTSMSKLDDGQRGAKSPIRTLGSIRAQRVAVSMKSPGDQV